MAVAGDTASLLGGGKFDNGAVTATFVHLYNAEIGYRPLLSGVSRVIGIIGSQADKDNNISSSNRTQVELMKVKFLRDEYYAMSMFALTDIIRIKRKGSTWKKL